MRTSAQSILLKATEEKRKAFCAFGVYPGDFVLDMMHIAGVEMVMIDMQHQEMTFTEAYRQMRVCDANGMATMVRAAGPNDGETIGRALDMGISAVMVPQIKTGSDARNVVSLVKFPPLGSRLGCCYTKGTYYGQNPENCYQIANQESYIELLLQNWEAMDNLEDIISTENIECYFLGTGHLSMTDIPGNYESPRIKEFEAKFLPLLEKYGKHCCMPVENRDTAAIARYKDMDVVKWIKLTHAVGVISDAYINFIQDVHFALGQNQSR